MAAEPCRFHFTGGCARGQACRFSHDDVPLAAVACPYYATPAGCKYGAACQFRHDRNTRSGAGASAAAAAALPALPSGDDLAPGFEEGCAAEVAAAAVLEDSDGAASLAAAAERTWGGLTVVDDADDFGRVPGASTAASSPWAAAAAVTALTAGLRLEDSAAPSSSSLPSDLCGQWAAAGACTRGDRCHLVHGDWCEGCGRFALHPTDEAAAACHAAECAAVAARAAALAASAEIECSICLERPLAKPRPGERRFGLLACDHAFCLGCIRSWRAQVVAAGAVVDVDAARGCPECRTVSHFVVPSATWPANAAEKAAIIDGYKSALARTPCRNFAAGKGTCPHGTSCLYLHADEHGVPVDRGASLRWVGDEDGVVKPMAGGVRLGDFLTTAGLGPGRGRRRG